MRHPRKSAPLPLPYPVCWATAATFLLFYGYIWLKMHYFRVVDIKYWPARHFRGFRGYFEVGGTKSNILFVKWAWNMKRLKSVAEHFFTVSTDWGWSDKSSAQTCFSIYLVFFSFIDGNMWSTDCRWIGDMTGNHQ